MFFVCCCDFLCMFYNVISNELPDKIKLKIVCTQTYNLLNKYIIKGYFIRQRRDREKEKEKKRHLFS